VSILELASKVDENSFQQRKAAASAVLDSKVIILDNPERYLANIWGLKLNTSDIDWKDVLIAMANANSHQQLLNGVNDWRDRVIRKLDTNLATSWRSFHYNDFVDQMVTAIDTFIPGYANKRQRGKMKQASESTRNTMKKYFSSTAAKFAILLATRERALLSSSISSTTKVSHDEVMKAVFSLLPYINVYGKYFELSSTIFAPQENDWGDLECFLYIGGGSKVVTSDRRWVKIGKEAGFEHLIIDANDMAV